MELPILLRETQISPFKFWYDGKLQDGIHYHQELFCRLQRFRLGQRSQVYHLGCKLTQAGSVTLLTISDEHCSLWVSLRDPIAQAVLSGMVVLSLPKINSTPSPN